MLFLFIGSGHLEEDFRQSNFLCPIDLKKLTLIFSIDLIERYKQMKNFFEHANSSSEIKWLENAINQLEKESEIQQKN